MMSLQQRKAKEKRQAPGVLLTELQTEVAFSWGAVVHLAGHRVGFCSDGLVWQKS